MDDIISKIDELIEKPRYLIDIFPCAVPQMLDSWYFMVEKILPEEPNRMEQEVL